MALPAFVNAAQGSNYTGTLVASFATGSLALTAGNLVVVMVRGGNATGITDTLGNTYTLRATEPDGNDVKIFSCANCIGGSAVVTAAFSPTAAYVSIVAFQFSGAATSSELVAAFTTAPVTVGTTIDLIYDTGGIYDSIIVGIAEVHTAGTFGFSVSGTSGDSAGYVEPVSDHTSASFFYRLSSNALTADTVRATCSSSGTLKHFLVAVFKPSSLVTDPRITQAPVEVLSLPTLPASLVTQAPVEILSQGGNLRTSQFVVESLAVPDPDFRISQLVVEALVAASVPFRISQFAIEALTTTSVPFRISQIVVETITSSAIDPTYEKAYVFID